MKEYNQVFDSEFYPTPDNLIQQMLAPITKHYDNYGDVLTVGCKRILEPSAGKGNIADYLCRYQGIEPSNISVIESNLELTHILNGKGYSVIDLDFLTYSGQDMFDLIVMNPPFSNGVDHLLKAWEILRNGSIICLLNAETIRNPYTQKRQLLSYIIEQHGEIEFVQDAFMDAERTTGVEVAIVRLTKVHTSNSGWDFDFSDSDFDSQVNEADFSPNALASNDMIEALVQRYESAKATLIEMNTLRQKYAYFTNGIVDVYYDQTPPDAEELEKRKRATLGNLRDNLQEKLDKLKEDFWKYVFNKTRVGIVTTSDFIKEFKEQQKQTSRLAFTYKNVMMVLETFYFNREEIMIKCVVDTFEEATKYHKDNMVHTEGWKTNKRFRLNSKVIVPNGVSFDSRWGTFTLYHGKSYNFYNDLDKSLCYLSGQQFDNDEFVSISDAIFEAIRLNNRNTHKQPIESTLFEIKLHKKGTVHLWFKDQALCDLFNQTVARNKNWMGDGSDD